MNGNELWQRKAVREFSLSNDGKLALLVISLPEECNIEDGPNCTENIVSVNEKGQDIFKLGPYALVSHIWLSSNHRYAGATVAEAGKTMQIFFNVSTGKIGAKLNELPGSVSIKDDGTVEFWKDIYRGVGSDGFPKLIGKEKVKSFQIGK
jgi:hypothetical protein